MILNTGVQFVFIQYSLRGPFSLEAYILLFCEIFLYYFFSNLVTFIAFAFSLWNGYFSNFFYYVQLANI